MKSQFEKGQELSALHAGPDIFVIPNPWDKGSARLLALAGFKALATSSAGFAFTLGRPDNAVGRDLMMTHLAAISDATDLPVSADLENGFGDSPEDAARTVREAARAGVVGGSIEDSTGRPDEPLYPLEFATERIRAAAEAAHSLTFPFALIARAETYLVGHPNLADTITRLQAYQDAGADVLYAPGLTTLEDVSAVVRAVDRPVNVLMGFSGSQLTLADLASVGVRRVSVGGSLARAAFGGFLNAMQEIQQHGTFNYSSAAISGKEINQRFANASERFGEA
jgi:2-methylisocitrate lyase-like PEP mutase family enzyme